MRMPTHKSMNRFARSYPKWPTRAWGGATTCGGAAGASDGVASMVGVPSSACTSPATAGEGPGCRRAGYQTDEVAPLQADSVPNRRVQAGNPASASGAGTPTGPRTWADRYDGVTTPLTTTPSTFAPTVLSRSRVSSTDETRLTSSRTDNSTPSASRAISNESDTRSTGPESTTTKS